MISLYATRTDLIAGSELAAFLIHGMPRDTISKLNKYHRWQDAQAHLLGRCLLRKGLMNLGYDIDCLNHITHSSYQRPFFNGVTDFNISHSGDIVMCAVGSGIRVGLDIEHKLDIDLEDYQSVFTEKEWVTIQQDSCPLDRFYQLWTWKEAFIKAVGLGWSMAKAEIPPLGHGNAVSKNSWFGTPLDFNRDYAGHLVTNLPLSDLGPIHFLSPTYLCPDVRVSK